MTRAGFAAVPLTPAAAAAAEAAIRSQRIEKSYSRGNESVLTLCGIDLEVPAGSFEASDGWLAIALVREDDWRRTCLALERPDWLENPAYGSFLKRVENQPALMAEMRPHIRTRTRGEWLERLRANDVISDTVAMVRDHTASTQIELRAATLATERCQQDVGRRQARLHGIADQRVALNQRTARAQDHLSSLQNRLEQMHEKLTALSERPGQMTLQRNDLISRLSTLEANKGQAEDALQFSDNQAAQTARALKDAETTLNTSREERPGHDARPTSMQ